MAETGGLDPWNFLKNTTKAVPAVRYAIAIGGLMAVIAITFGWFKSYDIRIVGLAIVCLLVLMTIMVIFAKVAVDGGPSLHLPARVFTGFCLALFMAVSTTLFGSILFDHPHLDWSFITHASAASSPVETAAEREAKEFEASGDREAANAIYYAYCQWHTTCSEFGQAFLPSQSLNNWARAKIDWQSARDRTIDNARFLRLKEKLDPANNVSCMSDADRKLASCEKVAGSSDELTTNGKLLQAMRPPPPTLP